MTTLRTVCLFASFLAVSLLAAADQVTQVDAKGEPQIQQGEVIEETYNEVSVEIEGIKGAKTSFKRDKVRKIEYDDRPAPYDEGERLLLGGEYEKALDNFNKVRKQGARAVFKQHATYKAAQCLEYLRKNDEAVAMYKELLKDFPKSRYFVEAWKGMVLNSLWKGAFADALASIQKSETDTKDLRDLPGSFPLEMRLLKGQVYEAQKKYKEAETEFRGVVSAAGTNFPDVGCGAKNGQGRCLVELKNFDEAERIYKEAADKGKDPATLAGAYNGLGDCYLAKAKEAKTAEAFKKALFAYLHGVVAYSPSATEGLFEFGKAFFFSAECSKALVVLDGADEGQKEKYRTRSQELYAETIEKFSGTEGSRWAESAKAAKGK